MARTTQTARKSTGGKCVPTPRACPSFFRRAPPPAKFVKPKAYNIYDANADSDDEADESGRSSKKVKSVRRNA